VVVDLGVSPPCERFVTREQLDEPEPFYPLRAMVCERCWLVQVGEYISPDDTFTEYAYFSSFSSSWVEHARRYVDGITRSLGLGSGDLVVELGSNDGYLLQHFVERGIPVLGIEPAANVAAAAQDRGIPTDVTFFGRVAADDLVADGRRASLVVGNNVLAQVPDLNDFVAGIARLLAPDGTVTLEFPHLLQLLNQNQFDTIYHEHFSYFSLATTIRIFRAHGLDVHDVELLPTHGGSLRVYGAHQGRVAPTPRIANVLAIEQDAHLETGDAYADFTHRVEALKRRLLAYLIQVRDSGRRVVGYGAPGKANTLLNYCGIRSDFVEFTVDRNPYKHGRFTPGTHIPIVEPARLAEAQPDLVWILPWNLRTEIADQLAGISEWGGQFMVAIPEVEVWSPPPVGTAVEVAS
jgi:SAM-dependent methyltransferase